MAFAYDLPERSQGGLVSPTFRDFSGRHVLELEAFRKPGSLAELCAVVREAETAGWSVHAMGSAWAFSAPAYCPGMVIQTDLLNRFPAEVQNAIKTPERDDHALVAVEAGIKIRDLCLALYPSEPELGVSILPAQQPLETEITLTVHVQNPAGEPVGGAQVMIENFNRAGLPVAPRVHTTNSSGDTSFRITFNARRGVDPLTHEWEVTGPPSGRVVAEGFPPVALPLSFEEDPFTPGPITPGVSPSVAASTLSMPTLGGAGGQSLAGAISTGTHGSDVARPPIGDFVRAMVIVGSGGVVRLLQPEKSPPDVDFNQLRSNLSNVVDPATIVDATNTQTFNAAIVSVGRFGVVYAYVLEVRDESQDFIYQHRFTSTWNDVKPNLISTVARAAANDEFLQVAVNPVRPADGNRRCYVTVQKKLPRDRVPTAGQAFGLGQTASIPVTTARAGRPDPQRLVPWEWALLAHILESARWIIDYLWEEPPVEGSLCADRSNPALERLQDDLGQVLAVATLTATPGREMFNAAIESLGRIGPEHKIGDVVADALKAGPPQIVDQIISNIFDFAQRSWLVHGTRYQISDNFDYENDCYRGDSVEIFFAVDDQLPRKAELVFAVFDSLRARGTPLAAWISLRFMARSNALLAMAGFERSCSIEVSMLRGGMGNDLALRSLQAIAITNGGRIHWGQQNDLSARDVAEMYPDEYPLWCASLKSVEGASTTFSNPFTKSHGLEPAPFVHPGRLEVSVNPPIISLGQPVSVTVSALDDQSRAPVAGTVTISNYPGGTPTSEEYQTSTAFTLTFERSLGEFEPDIGRPAPREDPSGIVTADGYDPVVVPFAFR